MEICVLGSGSSGNCIHVSSGPTHLLIDVGLSLRAVRTRLSSISCLLRELTAVLVTHEHTDHCRGLPALIKVRPDLRLLANENTAAGVELACKQVGAVWDIFETGASFEIGALRVQSFAVPHDAGDPVAYVLDDGAGRLGIATDFGVSTPVVRRHLLNCDVLILEANHDVAMVRDCDRPWSVKQRVLGRQGHLSNEQSAELLGEVLGPRLKAVFPAHLSDACNTPELAAQTFRRVLQSLHRTDITLYPTYRDRPSLRLRV